MDVEKLKKINRLSIEFKKHGIADSQLDAIQRATQVVRDDELHDVMKQTAAAAEEKTSPGFDNQYQIMLERQNRQLAQEICLLKEKMAKLESDIAELKCSHVRTVNADPEPKQERQATLQQKKECHPKQGNYTSDDVAVDKIFYFGKK